MNSTLRNRADELKKVMRAMQVAKQEMLKSKEKTVALISNFLKVDRDAAESTYAVYGKTVSGSGVPVTNSSISALYALPSGCMWTA